MHHINEILIHISQIYEESKIAIYLKEGYKTKTEIGISCVQSLESGFNLENEVNRIGNGRRPMKTIKKLQMNIITQKTKIISLESKEMQILII